jgi:hypothetical protein
VGFDVLTTCQPSTVWCSRERLPAAAAQLAKVRQSCSATDFLTWYLLLRRRTPNDETEEQHYQTHTRLTSDLTVNTETLPTATVGIACSKSQYNWLVSTKMLQGRDDRRRETLGHTRISVSAVDWTTRRTGFDTRQKKRIFPPCVQTSSEAHPASYPVGKNSRG